MSYIAVYQNPHRLTPLVTSLPSCLIAYWRLPGIVHLCLQSFIWIFTQYSSALPEHFTPLLYLGYLTMSITSYIQAYMAKFVYVRKVIYTCLYVHNVLYRNLPGSLRMSSQIYITVYFAQIIIVRNVQISAFLAQFFWIGTF